MMDYMQEFDRKTAISLAKMGLFDGIGNTVSRICNTSVDDAKYGINACDSISVLEHCLAYEKKTTARKSLLTRISSRIKKLKKEANK